MAATPVYLEVGKKRVFACSLDWPGWCRSGKSEEAALETLAAYAARYAPVAELAAARFPASAGKSLDVVERAPGSATTDFGAIGVVPAADSAPLSSGAAPDIGDRRFSRTAERGVRFHDGWHTARGLIKNQERLRVLP